MSLLLLLLCFLHTGYCSLSRAGQYDQYNKIARQCCKEQKVESSCMHLCSYTVDVDEKEIACQANQCADAIKKIVYCLGNEMNNQPCCNKKGIRQPECSPLCNGKKKVAPLSTMFSKGGAQLKKYIPCFFKAIDALACHLENHNGKSQFKSFQQNKWKRETLPKTARDLASKMCKSG